MNIPLEVARAQGRHGIKGAAHGIKGGRPRLDLSAGERTERRRKQKEAYRRRKGIPPKSSTPSGDVNRYFEMWGKLPGEPLTPEEFAEREPLWNAEVLKEQEAERQKQLRAEERLQERRKHREQYEREARRQWTPSFSPLAATPSVGRNQPCPCGSGRKLKKCCGR